jgi:hypothetical protein
VQREVPPPSLARSAEKSVHETQLRDEGGRWRASLFRRADTRPKLKDARFFS